MTRGTSTRRISRARCASSRASRRAPSRAKPGSCRFCTRPDAARFASMPSRPEGEIMRGKMWWIGFSMSAIVVLFLLLDAGMKLATVGPVLEAGQQIGFPGAAMARKLGALLLLCTLIYVYPRTSLLGAILVTG